MSERDSVKSAGRAVAPYETPELVVHGTIDEVTRGGSGPFSDGGQGSAFIT